MMAEYQETAQKKKIELEERAQQLDEKEERMIRDLEEKERIMKERLKEETSRSRQALAEEKRGFEEEKQEWEEEKKRIRKTKAFEKIVTLNVGGSKYNTTLSTLTKYPDSMLGAMFSGRHALVQQEDGSYFIDRDGETFKYILMYLRDDRLARAIIPQLDTKLQLHLAYDAEYFQLLELAKLSKVFGNAVTLNVGGSRYTTTLSTLTKYPDSMLGAMFSGGHAPARQDADSFSIGIDEDSGESFKYVLSYLRNREQMVKTLSNLQTDDLERVEHLGNYFQLSDLETHVIVHKNQRKGQGTKGLSTANIREDYNSHTGGYATTSHTHNVEYSIDTLTCTRICNQSFNGVQISAGKYECIEFTGSFKQCNVSEFQFINCHFGKCFSFEGTILHNTVFQHCSGLVSNKVHFAPWQVAQAKFQPELLEALKSNGCVY